MAEIFTKVVADSTFVWITKLAVVNPAGTITEEGMDSIAFAPEVTARLTGRSTAAGAFNVTVAVV